jgi:hypothetical protein
MGNDGQAHTYSGGPCRSLPHRIKWALSIQALKDVRKYDKLLLRLAIEVRMLSQHLHAA